MLKRSVVKIVVAVSLSLAVLCIGAAPAQAAAWSPGDPGLSLWSSFFDSLVRTFAGFDPKPGAREQKTTTTTTTNNGGTAQGPCLEGTTSCNADSGGASADPFGKP